MSALAPNSTLSTLTPVQKPIFEKAMLVGVTIRQPTFRKEDKKANRQIAELNNANVNRYNTRKELISRTFLEDIDSINTAIRAAWRDKSLPWFEGVRIMPSIFYFEVIAEIKKLIHAREELVEKFLARYDEAYDEAKTALNGGFNEQDYPPVAKLRHRFSVELTTFQIPRSEDFRVPMGDEEQQALIKAQVDVQVTSKVAQALREPWQRVYKVVEHMSERLHAYAKDESGKVINKFHDTVVDNVMDLASILPGLNVADDPALDELAASLEAKLCKYHPDELRVSKTLRNEVAEEADRILAQVSDFLA